jgi:hypothetical protein
MPSARRGALAAALALVVAAPAPAKVVAPAPIPVRVARSDAVLVGKVAKIAPEAYKAPDGAEYSVAFVEVKDALSGVKGATLVRVAFHAGENRRFPHLNLQAGQEGLFFLRYINDKDSTFTAPMYYDVVDAKNADVYMVELAESKRCTKLLEAPEAGLTSKDADERLLTAGLLILQYRTARDGAGRFEPADAKLSKLILQTLADADWNKQGPYPQVPHLLFSQLGLTEKDGWKSPPAIDQFQPAAKKWLREHADTYRIQRVVAPRK